MARVCLKRPVRMQHSVGLRAPSRVSSAILERLDKQGIEPRALGNDDFARLLKADHERMAEVVKAAGAKVE